MDIKKDNINDLEGGFVHLKNGSKTLYVFFGGIMQGFGMPVFEFKNFVNQYKIDALLIRDLHQGWYFFGVDKDTPNFENVEQKIQDYYVKGGYDSMKFIGNSMGGFAALKMGISLKVEHVLIFSPQTSIHPWFKIKKFDYRWLKQMVRIYRKLGWNNPAYDLLKVIERDDIQSDVTCYYGENDRLDSIHAKRLGSLKKIKIVSLKGDHGLIKRLRKSRKLKELIIDNADIA